MKAIFSLLGSWAQWQSWQQLNTAGQYTRKREWQPVAYGFADDTEQKTCLGKSEHDIEISRRPLVNIINAQNNSVSINTKSLYSDVRQNRFQCQKCYFQLSLYSFHM